MQSKYKIIKKSEVNTVLSAARREGKRIVFTNGCFDILHTGHIDLLDKAESLGEIVIVGINSDDSVMRLKGEGRPINSLEDRAKVLLSLKSVDLVTVFTEDTPSEIIKEVKPDVLIKGADYKLDNIVGRDFVESYGGEVVSFPLTKGKSTSSMIHRINKS